MLVIRAKKKSSFFIDDRQVSVQDFDKDHVKLTVTVRRGERFVIQQEDGSAPDVAIHHAQSRRHGQAALAIDAPRSVTISRAPNVPSTPTTKLTPTPLYNDPETWEAEYEQMLGDNS